MFSTHHRFSLSLFLLIVISSTVYSATVNVTVGVGFSFSPNDVTINAGDTIQWNWMTGGHSTTSTTVQGGCISGGLDPWDSGILQAGATFSRTFNTSGNYSYKCNPHCGMPMVGIVRVVDFNLTCVPTTVISPVNGSGNSICTISSVNNFNAAVDLNVTGLPAGVTFGFSADPVTPPAGGNIQSTVTLNVDGTVLPGSYPITLSGQNGDRAKTVNMTLVVAPLFLDDFGDSDVTDWSFTNGTWSVVMGSLVGTHDRKATGLAPYQMAQFVSVEALMRTSSTLGSKTSLIGWFIDKRTLVELLMKEDKDRWILKQKQNGVIVSKGKVVQTILPNTDYRVRIKMDQPSNSFQVFVDGVLAFSIPAFSTGTGAPGVRVKGTTSTFGEILVY